MRAAIEELHEPLEEASVPMRVLVAVDGSAPALHACEVLTKLLPAGSEVRLLTVLSYSDYPFSLIGGHMSDERDRIETAHTELATAQADARAVLENAGFRVVVVHRFGYAPDEIVSELMNDGADLVVLGRRGLRGPARWISSVSDRVTHRTDTPVLLVA